jgi:hypothetical protein
MEQRVAQRVTNGLGWFSIGLGLAELATPKLIADLIGAEDSSTSRKILRFYGAREFAAGVGMLSPSNPSGWLWARVAGDILDLSSLSKVMISNGNGRGRAIAATAAVTSVTVADVCCAIQHSNGKNNRQQMRKGSAAITSSTTIARSADEVYEFWRSDNGERRCARPRIHG